MLTGDDRGPLSRLSLTLEKVGYFESDDHVVDSRKEARCLFALAGGFDSGSGRIKGWLRFHLKIW
jgi:hypothetical protein